MARSAPSVIRGTSLDREAPVRSTTRSLLTALRPGQWTKNLLVFAALLFGERLLDPEAVLRSTLAFVAFCLLSSAVYLLNDVVDRRIDASHPLKSKRPVASGALRATTAAWASAGLAVAGLVLASTLGAPFASVAAGYGALQVAYTYALKHVVILDVLTIAVGFVLRALGGGVVIDVPVSGWLLLCTILLALFLAMSKRRHELTLLEARADQHRPILSEYSPYLLDQMIAVVAASTLMAYALYTLSPETVAKFGEGLILTIPFPLYGIFRYLYLVHRRQGGGSPSETLLDDRPLLACIALWAAVAASIIYA